MRKTCIDCERARAEHLFPLDKRKSAAKGQRLDRCEDCDRTRRNDMARRAKGVAHEFTPTDVTRGSRWRWEREGQELIVTVERIGQFIGRPTVWLRPEGRTQSVTCNLRDFRAAAVPMAERRTA